MKYCNVKKNKNTLKNISLFQIYSYNIRLYIKSSAYYKFVLLGLLKCLNSIDYAVLSCPRRYYAANARD